MWRIHDVIRYDRCTVSRCTVSRCININCSQRKFAYNEDRRFSLRIAELIDTFLKGEIHVYYNRTTGFLKNVSVYGLTLNCCTKRELHSFTCSVSFPRHAGDLPIRDRVSCNYALKYNADTFPGRVLSWGACEQGCVYPWVQGCLTGRLGLSRKPSCYSRHMNSTYTLRSTEPREVP